MVKISCEYQGDLHCTAVHAPSGSTLGTDAPKDNQGKGECFSPTDLVATALITCIATTMGIAAKKRNVDLKGMRFEVTKEMSTTPPRKIVRLATEVWMPIARTHPEAAELERAGRACPVYASLHPTIAKPVIFRWSEC